MEKLLLPLHAPQECPNPNFSAIHPRRSLNLSGQRRSLAARIFPRIPGYNGIPYQSISSGALVPPNNVRLCIPPTVIGEAGKHSPGTTESPHALYSYSRDIPVLASYSCEHATRIPVGTRTVPANIPQECGQMVMWYSSRVRKGPWAHTSHMTKDV